MPRGPRLAVGPGIDPRGAATLPGRTMMGASIAEPRTDDGRGKGRRGHTARWTSQTQARQNRLACEDVGPRMLFPTINSDPEDLPARFVITY